MTVRRLAAAFAVLTLLATAAFVIGVGLERSSTHPETATEHVETGEGSEAHEEGDEGRPADESGGETETIAGVDVESTPVVVLGVMGSLVLAGAVLRWPRREVFAVAALLCVAFAVLDGRELAHQLDENSDDVATLAALTLVLHLGAAAVATAGLARRPDRPGAVPT